MKPVPLLAALVPALAVTAALAMLRHDLTWGGAAALFYGTLALAELGYLAVLIGMEARPFQERSARIGAGAE